MEKQQNDVTQFSDINYSVFELPVETITENKPRVYNFKPVSGKIIASLIFRLRTVGRGKNILTLSGEGHKGRQTLLSLWCEGVGILAWDGAERKMICRYRDDEWCSVWVSLDTNTGKYDVCIDGKKVLSGAGCINRAEAVSRMELSSRMGDLQARHVMLYRNPVQSVHDAAGERPIFDVRNFGAVGDGKTPETESIQKAIDQCSDSGGGIIYLHGGTYVSGMIELKKNTELYIETDAELKGLTDSAAYPTMTAKNNPNWNMIRQGPQKALVFADGVDNLVIQGGGTIKGSGNFAGDYGSEITRPCAILLVGCKNSKILNVYICDAGMWTVPLVECDSFYMRDVNINSCWFPNRDGIDVCDCHDVLIENCTITADDDAVCLKSGHERCCDNIIVRQLMISSVMANAVKFGTYSYGGFTNCSVIDCVIKDTRHAALAVEIVDGGVAENILFKRIDIRDCGEPFFIILGDRGNIPSWGTHKIGAIRNIEFDDIRISELSRNYGSYISGFSRDGKRYSPEKISFNNIIAEFRGGVLKAPDFPPEYTSDIYPECDMFGVLPASVFFIRHCEHVTIENCCFAVPEKDAREQIIEI